MQRPVSEHEMEIQFLKERSNKFDGIHPILVDMCIILGEIVEGGVED